MAYKINIATKDGKTFKIETSSEELEGKELGETIDGGIISPELAGYELKITGASDKAGFTAMADVEGVALKRKLLSYGKGMKKRPKYEGKKKRTNTRPKGLRLRKTVRGRMISPAIVQINTQLVKEGGKKLAEVFPDQNKTPEAEAPKEEATPAAE